MSIWALPPFTFNYLDYNRVNFHKLERYIDRGALDIPGILSKTWSFLTLERCVSFVPVGAISYHFLLLSCVDLGSDKGFCRKLKEIDWTAIRISNGFHILLILTEHYSLFRASLFIENILLASVVHILIYILP